MAVRENEPGGPRTSSVGEHDTEEAAGSGPRLKPLEAC